MYQNESLDVLDPGETVTRLTTDEDRAVASRAPGWRWPYLAPNITHRKTWRRSTAPAMSVAMMILRRLSSR
jgi:hypothetical protein